MATIVPFKGILYNRKRIKKIGSVVAPPYDIISAKTQEACYRLSKYNIVRIELGKCFKKDTGSDNCYSRAEKFFRQWLKKGVLQQDAEPAVYVYLHRFPKGERKAARWGFIALLKLEREGYRSVYPHEHTLLSPKEDRLKLMEALQANISPIFFLFPDQRRQVEHLLKREVKRTRPLWNLSSGKEQHTFWRLNRPQMLEFLQGTFKKKKLFIADGHHRFEVALAFRRKAHDSRNGNLSQNHVMAYFSNLLDENLTILPIHRLIRRLPFKEEELWKRLNRFFTARKAKGLRVLLSRLEKSKRAYVYGTVVSNTPYLLQLRKGISLNRLVAHCPHSSTWKRLEVTVLHEVVLKKLFGLDEETIRREVAYERDLPTCIEGLNQGQYRIGFFLRPPRIQEVQRIALAREKMPQKSTYFYPKPLTGLVLHRFEP